VEEPIWAREDTGAAALFRAPRWIVAIDRPIVSAKEVAGGAGQFSD